MVTSPLRTVPMSWPCRSNGPALWSFGSELRRYRPDERVTIGCLTGLARDFYRVLGPARLSEFGFLVEVFDDGVADDADADPFPLVDMTDDGDPYVRRVKGYADR